jgi:hypothetical protein
MTNRIIFIKYLFVSLLPLLMNKLRFETKIMNRKTSIIKRIKQARYYLKAIWETEMQSIYGGAASRGDTQQPTENCAIYDSSTKRTDPDFVGQDDCDRDTTPDVTPIDTIHLFNSFVIHETVSILSLN